MEKLEMLYEGKAKKIYKTEDKDLYVVEYKDDATAFNGLKKDVIESKGILNNAIASIFFELLEKEGIPTHFVKKMDDRNMLVKSLEIVPIEVVVRNITAGSLAKKLGMEEGIPLKKTVVELYYKDDELGDPMINSYHIAAMGLCSPEELKEMEELGLKINEILVPYLKEKKIELVDFKLEFGRHNGKIILGDEISPDTCRFWDLETREKMDKDRFRRDLGNVVDSYIEVLNRLEA